METNSKKKAALQKILLSIKPGDHVELDQERFGMRKIRLVVSDINKLNRNKYWVRDFSASLGYIVVIRGTGL